MSEATALGWVPRDDNLGVRLAMLRQRMGWNVKQAATECGVTVQSWRDWERGAACRDQERIARKISERTGASYLWVFAGLTEPPRNPFPAGPQTQGAAADHEGATGRYLPGTSNVIPLGAQPSGPLPECVPAATRELFAA